MLLVIQDIQKRKQVPDFRINNGYEYNGEAKIILLPSLLENSYDNPTDIFVEADVGWIVQVLTNLLDNALKFTREDNTILISIQSQINEKKKTREVVVSIRDNGEGYSLGGHIAQAFTLSYPDKVNSLILVATTCGGKDGIPKPPEFIKFQAEIVNKSQNNVSLSAEDIKTLNVASLGSGWIKLHPESLEGFENITSLQQLKPGLPPETEKNQANLVAWEDTNWSGACDAEAKLAKPTLVIAGTDDNNYMPHMMITIL